MPTVAPWARPRHRWQSMWVVTGYDKQSLRLTRHLFRGTEGSGIPQTIFALRPEVGEAGSSLLQPHVAVAA
jgi:hypothetical protein